MKLFQTISLSLALAATSTVALADDAKKPATPAADAPAKADVDKFLAFFDKLVDAIVADADDCPKMAKDINGLVDGNADIMKRAAEAKAKNQQLPKDAQDHMAASVKKMMPALQKKCMQDKDVSAAFQRMQPKK